MRVSVLWTLTSAVCVASLALAQPTEDHSNSQPDSEAWGVAWPDAPSRAVTVDTREGTWMSVDVSPDGAWVVFDLLGDIYRVPITGGEAEPLRVGRAWEMQPRYSPDGAWIAFTSDAGGGDNLWVMSAEARDGEHDGEHDGERVSERITWQVSKEDHRLVNSPTWTPDGRALIGRKHFTSRRSLGAGEMWRYDWRGDYSGVALTKRASDQKDEGEPAISPDGRWLYYSQDLSPGKRFEYNKDSHRGIYGIRRLDLETRELITLTSGGGGAARPTPSPDGHSLAFIRRVEGRTTLWVRDLKSGAERVVDSHLERDLQETWAIHGVYPQIAWTPDSRALVYWASGKLWRLDLACGGDHEGESRGERGECKERDEIPFHVKREHQVVQSLRIQHDPARLETMPVKMLRWVRRHGRRVMFQALGHVYLLDLDEPDVVHALHHHRSDVPPMIKALKQAPDTQKQVPDTQKQVPDTQKQVPDTQKQVPDTSQTQVPDTQDLAQDPHLPHAPSPALSFALSPSWSDDGGRVIYATWDDERLGQIRAYDLETGSDEELSVGPGHYLDPMLSADEEWLVYRRVPGGWITSPRYAHRVGLYALHLPSGREILLAREGRDPHFGPDPHRVYFTRVHKKKLQLRSTELSFTPTHLRESKLIAEGEQLQLIRISPRGRWIAFQSDFSLWISAKPHSRGPLKLSTKSKDRALFKLSDDSGFDPQWSRDGASISWSLGSTLYEARVPTDDLGRDPVSLKSDALKSARAGLTEHTTLELRARRATPQGPLIALIGGRILTMRSGVSERDDLIERGIVLIEGERITAVGDYDTLIDQLPSDVIRIDVEGHTVIPGLIDVHAHSAHSAHGITPQVNWQYLAALAFGVTTIHDPSHHSQSVFSSSELVEAGQALGPRIFSTGTILYGADGPARARIKSLEDARRHLRRMRALGAFSVKSYNQPLRSQRQQVLTAARELGMLVVPEGGSLFHHNMTQVIDGHTGIEHAIPLAKLYGDVIQLWAGTEVGYTPTFNVAYGGIMGENYWYQESRVYEHSRLRRFVPSRALDARARRPFIAPRDDWNHIDVARSARDLMRAGVRVHAGAHGQREGLGMHWEMWSMAQGGFTPYEAIRAATLHGAMYLGLSGALGRVQPGYLADLAIIQGDVLQDLRLSERVTWVIRGGSVYQASDLARVAPAPTPAPRLPLGGRDAQTDQQTHAQGLCGCNSLH